MKNKNENYVLLTGATGGLGTAFAYELCKLNRNIIISSTNEEKLDILQDELLELNPNIEVLTYVCDLSNKKQLQGLFEFIDENQLVVDELINNAGYITEGSIKNADINTLMKCIQVNCEGTIFITKNILDRFSKDLKIITITSLACNYPMPYMAIYSSTKSMLTNFMLALRNEYKKDKLKVLVVQPGAIATSKEMIEAIKAQGFKGKISSVPAATIAKKSLKKCDKNKRIFVPGFANKCAKLFSKICPQKIQVAVIGKMWLKSQKKRNIN